MTYKMVRKVDLFMAIEKVREYFKTLGIEDQIKEFDQSSATVELAAEAVGTEPARICKTLSFKKPEGGCILIQTAGDTKIKNGKFKKKFGFKAKMLSPDEVIEYTGHAIGGVCAFGIDREDVEIYTDESLKRFDTVFGSLTLALHTPIFQAQSFQRLTA